MEILDKKQNQITFKADIDESLANSIRRSLNQIPTVAVEEVEILKNGSSLYDEVIAHRIGLVPLKTDKVSEKGNGKLKLIANKEGVVLSKDISGNVDLVYGEIPITYLDKDQELELTATTKAGMGSEHVKYSPGLMFYRNIHEITVDKKFLPEIKRSCPDCEVKEKGEKIIVFDDNAKEVGDVIEGIVEKAQGNIEIQTKPGLIITIESFGQMDVKDMLKKSVDSLKKDLNEVSKKVK